MITKKDLISLLSKVEDDTNIVFIRTSSETVLDISEVGLFSFYENGINKVLAPIKENRVEIYLRG